MLGRLHSILILILLKISHRRHLMKRAKDSQETQLTINSLHSPPIWLIINFKDQIMALITMVLTNVVIVLNLYNKLRFFFFFTQLTFYG